MNHTAQVLCLAAIVAAASGPALAQEMEKWGEAGKWAILVDPSLGDGCLIEATLDSGTVVRMGYDRNVGNAYLVSFDKAWGEIEEGAEYGIWFDLDGASHEVGATGVRLGDLPGADIYLDDPEILQQIGSGNRMSIYNESGKVLDIDLAGTQAALEQARKCQDEKG